MSTFYAVILVQFYEDFLGIFHQNPQEFPQIFVF